MGAPRAARLRWTRCNCAAWGPLRTSGAFLWNSSQCDKSAIKIQQTCVRGLRGVQVSQPCTEAWGMSGALRERGLAWRGACPLPGSERRVEILPNTGQPWRVASGGHQCSPSRSGAAGRVGQEIQPMTQRFPHLLAAGLRGSCSLGGGLVPAVTQRSPGCRAPGRPSLRGARSAPVLTHEGPQGRVWK